MKKHRLFAISFLVVMTVWITFPVFGQEKAKTEKTGLTVARLVIGTGVENKEPEGVAETFPATTEKVYCFLEATDIPEDVEITFIWFHGEKEMLKSALPLKMGPRWRTYADKNLYGLTGDWKVEVRDANGNLIKDVKFKVE
jgi:hypothetical protein